MKNLKQKRTKFLNLKRKPWGAVKTKKIRIKTLFLLILGFFGALGVFNTANWFIDSYSDATNYSLFIPAINVVHAKSFDTIQEEVDYYLDQRNVSDSFRENLYCLIKNESGWNKEETNPNIHKNGMISIDRGLLQWNSQTAPVKVSNECSFDVKCSINTFVDYIEGGGSWYRWFGWSGNCV